MGGGNGQKSKMAREKNLEKQKAVKGSQLESNKKAMSIQLLPSVVLTNQNSDMPSFILLTQSEISKIFMFYLLSLCYKVWFCIPIFLSAFELVPILLISGIFFWIFYSLVRRSLVNL